MISWVYLVLTIGIFGGIVHFFFNLAGDLVGGFANTFVGSKVYKRSRLSNIGLWIAGICFIALVLYGGWDIFTHFFKVSVNVR